MAKKIKVALGERSYEIFIGSGALAGLKRRLVKMKKSAAVVISDYNVGPLYAKRIKKALKGVECHIITIPAGERYKTLYAASAIYDKLIDLNIGRDAVILALGGGVIGDLAGFVAGTYLRGVDLVQLPTTLLAMVDSSIGGKCAVDHKKGKNLIGVFHQPRLVISDIETLRTLPVTEIKNGLAEVLKYGIIKDPAIIKLLSGNPRVNSALFEKIVYLCARIKAEVVSKDEKEVTGLRMILNYGHTVGHAVESLLGYKKFKHGEAVGFGMLAAALIARKKKMIDKKTYYTIASLILKLKLPVRIELGAEEVLKRMRLDKKVKDGKLRLVLPARIGKVAVRDDIQDKVILSALRELGCR